MEATRERVAAYQSVGQFGARGFDNVFFNLKIPRFDGKITLHAMLAKAAGRAEKIAGSIDEGTAFRAARAQIRKR
jgi:hypothetical protein